MSTECAVGAASVVEPSKRFPKVSIIVPVPPGMDNPRSIESLKDLDYPEDCYEVILARGTAPSKQRNVAAKKAGGDFLFFPDSPQDKLVLALDSRIIGPHGSGFDLQNVPILM